MAAYYNEFDPFAAAWLRELIHKGLIADGDVDERSILDVLASDLRGFDQHHFFAGIGVWSYALRRAGWPDSRPVWTGSCPCQPLSSAGKRKGHADERHLWPAFHSLIAECRPPIVLGEQVASKDGREWFSAVRADLEADGYACGAADLCAAGVGAPHIRQRLWWVAERGVGQADAHQPGLEGRFGAAERTTELVAGQGSVVGRLVDADRGRARPLAGDHRETGEEASRGARPDDGAAVCDGTGAVGWLADSDGGDASTEGLQRGGEQRQQPQDGGVGRVADRAGARLEGSAGTFVQGRSDGPTASSSRGRTSPTNGLWRDADWLHCRDGKWRPVEPGTFPLAHGAPARVGRLRGYGNAIVAEAAATFIEAYLDTRMIEQAA